MTNGPFAPIKTPAKPEINPQNQSFRIAEKIKLSKGAQVKNKIVPAINHMRISSGIAPNNSIPPRDPIEVAIRIFCIKCHLKNSLYTNVLDKLFESWIAPCKGIRVPGEKDCANATSIIMPPPTLKIDVNKEVTKDSAAKILMNSRDI